MGLIESKVYLVHSKGSVIKMKGRFFYLIYQNHNKIIQADDTFEEYCLNAAQSLALPSKLFKRLTGFYTYSNGYQRPITNEENYCKLLSIMPLCKITTLAIELKETALLSINRQNENSIFPNQSDDISSQANKLTFKDMEPQTDDCLNLKQTKKKHLFKSNKAQAINALKTIFKRDLYFMKTNILNQLHSKLNKTMNIADKEKEYETKEIDNNCNECKHSLMSGIKYQCSQCMSYYLCEDCEEKLAFNHGHSFIKLRPSLVIKDNSIEDKIKQQLELYFNKVMKYEAHIFNSIQCNNLVDTPNSNDIYLDLNQVNTH